MTHRQASWIHQALTSALPRRRIRHLARRLGVVRRRRKVDVVALVYSLVLGFGDGERRTLTGLRRAYQRATGVRLAPSSFYARFNAEFVELMSHLAHGAITTLSRTSHRGSAVFRPFVEVLAIDSTLIRLHDALAEIYPSVWTNYMKAAAKLGMVTNVVGRGPKTMTLTHGSRHDVHLLRPGRWLRGRLLVFDLGFFKAPLFESIRKHQGYFLSRTRKHGNPVIVRSHRPEHLHLVGLKLRDAQDAAAFEMLDVDAEMGFIDKADKFRHYRLTFRFVAVYNERAGQWHRYVTNTPPSMLAAEHFTAVYAARWEIELLFRELKTHYRLDHMPSSNRFISESLLYAAVLTLVVSRRLNRLVRRRDRLTDDTIPFDRWARLVASISQQLLEIALLPRRRRLSERRLLAYLQNEGPDPNRARLPLGSRAQQGLYVPA